MAGIKVTEIEELSTDGDSSTDNEEAERLREAVVESFSLGADIYKTRAKKTNEDYKSKPSLRNNDNDAEDAQEDDLQVAPEVKCFLSKRLSEFLDGLISTVKETPRNFSTQASKGIKLFRESSLFLNGASLMKAQEAKCKVPKKRHYSSSSDSEEGEIRLREAAVTSDFIISNAAPLQHIDDVPKEKQKKDNIHLNGCIDALEAHSDKLSIDPLCKRKKKKKKSKMKEFNDSCDKVSMPKDELNNKESGTHVAHRCGQEIQRRKQNSRRTSLDHDSKEDNVTEKDDIERIKVESRLSPKKKRRKKDKQKM